MRFYALADSIFFPDNRLQLQKFVSLSTCSQLFLLYFILDDSVAKYTSICRARHNQIKRLSCSEIVLNNIGLNALPNDSMSKSCDDLSAKIGVRIQQQNEVNYIPEPRTPSDLKDQSQSSRCVNGSALPIIQITMQTKYLSYRVGLSCLQPSRNVQSPSLSHHVQCLFAKAGL